MNIIDYKNLKTILIVVALSIVGLVYYGNMFVIDGIPYYPSEDVFFHLNRLIGLENVWQSPVNFNSFSNNGPLTNAFYPWLTMYPMWIIYKICGNYVFSFKLYCLALTIATLLISYYSMKKISNSTFGALCFSILYAFSAYRFADVFRREALGESLAITFMPIVILGIYVILFDDHCRWYILAIGMTLVAYSHILSVFMASVVIAIVLIVSIPFIQERIIRIGAIIKAAVLTLAMSAGAIVPILVYYGGDTVRPEGTGELARDTADSLSQIIVNSFKNEPTAHGIGLMTLIALVMCILMLLSTLLEKGEETLSRDQRVKAVVFFFSGLIVFLSTSSILPWELLGEHTPLGNIQFVWRLNAYSTILLLTAFSYMLPSFIRDTKVKIFVIGIVLFISVGLHYAALSALSEEEEHRITEQEVENGLNDYHAPYFDYSSEKAFQYYLDNGYTLDKYYLDEDDINPNCIITSGGSLLSIEVEKEDRPQTIDVPIFWYDSMEVTVNNKNVSSAESERGSTLICLPHGKKTTINISYHYPPLVIISWCFSFVVVLLLAAAQVLHRRSA